jgi:ABC-type amino acid transport substrate-binding protein
MKIIYLLFFLVHIALSQKEVVILVDHDSTIVDVIEQNIIKNVFEILNKKEPNSKYSYRFEQVTFDQIFKQLRDDSSHVIMSLSTITVTEKRKEIYDFSSIYIPSSTVIFALKSEKHKNWKKPDTKIGYQKNTIHEQIIFSLKEKYEIIPIPYNSYTDIESAIRNKQIPFSLGDNTEVWNQNGFEILERTEIQNGTGVAILYPKGSNLKKKLEKYLYYYVHSKIFYQFLKQTYGNEISKYFRDNLGIR